MLLREANSLKVDKKSKTRLEAPPKPSVQEQSSLVIQQQQQEQQTQQLPLPSAPQVVVQAPEPVSKRKLVKQPSSAEYPTRQLEQELLLERVQHGRTRQQLDQMTESVMTWSQECKQMQLELEELRSRQPETVIMEVKPSFVGTVFRALFFGGVGAAITWYVLTKKPVAE